jgi:predicted enzyme related to lactoylglutathione lyase
MRSAGATVIREAADNYGARGATVRDPFGHRWMLSGPVALPLATELIRDGDLGYVSWWTPDADRAARFFGHVLGWSYDTDRGPRRHLRNTSLSTGIDGGHAGSRLFCCYAVHDLDAALERVRAAGGEAQAAEEAPFGRIATCTDPQGLEFAVWQAGGQLTRPALNGVRAGDLSYVTYGAPSSATFRDFYAAVLGWTFSPGRVGDGWEPTDVAPMSGVAGGVETTWIVPMWKVDDVEAAAARVVGAGGTIIEEPARQPYGMSALCADDQGGRFYLGDA